MIRRTLLLAFGAAIVATTGCSGSGSAVPVALDGASGPSAPSNALTSSAFRSVASVPPSSPSTERATQGLGAIPMPLGAIPMGLGAIPMPLGAIPMPGAPAAPVAAACPNGGCHALLRQDVAINPNPLPTSLAGGLEPGWADLIYNLPLPTANDGVGRTVAVIVAFDDPAAEADLGVFRRAFGLSPCTTANGCFTKIAQDGTTDYPSFNAGWAMETSLDVDTISGICNNCNIMVVEAKSANIPDLAAAVDMAAARGATVINNSYGVPEAADNVQYNSHYNHPGIPVVASAGDKGFGVSFPASSQYVIAVGGTSLFELNNGAAETAWPLSGAGCSAYIPKPSWQTDKSCSKRMVNDIAVVADSSTGMAVYDSVLNGSSGGWTIIGGTSMSAAIVSAMIAVAAHDPTKLYTAQHLYGNEGSYYRISFGSDGFCSVAYFCNATGGYSGPVGMGAPKNNGLFN